MDIAGGVRIPTRIAAALRAERLTKLTEQQGADDVCTMRSERITHLKNHMTAFALLVPGERSRSSEVSVCSTFQRRSSLRLRALTAGGVARFSNGNL